MTEAGPIYDVMINIDQGTVHLGASNETAPITTYLDQFDDDCEKKNAVVIVAGPFAGGWFTVDLRELKPMVVH